MNLLHVVFQVGAGEYALPAEEVLEMESYEGATPVPGAPEFVAGLVQIRGRVIPVVDLRARFGLPPVERALGARVVVVAVDDRTVGLLVDSAREVIELPPDRLQPPPKLVAEHGGGFVRSVAQVGAGAGDDAKGPANAESRPTLKGRLLMLIDLRKVIGEEPLS